MTARTARGDLAHSVWILDPDAPHGTDTRLHIGTETEERIDDGVLERLAGALGVASVKLLVLMNKVLERKRGRGDDSAAKDPRITRLDL